MIRGAHFAALSRRVIESPHLSAALGWLRAGVAPIPIAAGTKRPVIAWRYYQTHLPAEADLRRWWWFGSKFELAIVCGGSRGLTVLDFDTIEAYREWRAGCDLETYTVCTPRGRHVYLFADDTRSYDHPLCEVRSSGCYVLTIPSRHPSGATYKPLNDAPIATVRLSDVLPGIAGGAGLNNQIPGLPAVGRGAGRIESLKSALSLLETARAAGVELRSSDRGAGRWYVARCPFHDDAHPSFWLDAERGRFGCRAPHCPAHRSGDVLDFIAALRGCSVREVLAGGTL